MKDSEDFDMNREDSKKLAMHISNVSILGNVFLSVFKMLAGVIANSGAMLSDGVHSLSDVISTIVVIVGIRISSKKADESHPYGHDRFESVAAIILANLLILTGLGIGYKGVRTIMAGTGHIKVPGMLALVAAAVSIVVKELMFHYTKNGARKIKSDALMADAWHHRSDALSSIGSLIGIGGAMLGFPIMDPLASIVICLFIIKAGAEIYMEAVGKMVDSSVSQDVIDSMREYILKEKGVVSVDKIQTRLFGGGYYVDLEIAADAHQTLHEAHEIAHTVHDDLEEAFPDIRHVMIHVNPVFAND